ncbi:Uncharacterized protein ALO70_03693 [Pseudomonas amygdali pv. eriobotryae]|uniref:RNA-directed DNA polymerase n=1 Tax=Pseudomonas amygdali pv. eriobotryae TaxID=129137 RepID=A0A0P9U7N1_PSEA0|nr:reverse transcriptase family protein [Pseudomonas amygdali]KPX21473.1 Uncharacterized protein ALO70_03693 [Pseudomonas amygdali pv. eriobotryae]KWS75500.1 hypothetical protein AL052_08645 [Pseudomonas amygdali pv. eriobotryae]RMM01103.1 hypothetical protein ALQ86_01386 [Pseudomonas amygdali pv. eriobotryae]RMO64417.1 hypothetical protein ALQ39_04065 [Pseudomonas amygdali pv. eriobotryae]GFZ73584.1 RNA-directed DNA polymerase [Pseudomonas amygdali pv. eriobotryae]
MSVWRPQPYINAGRLAGADPQALAHAVRYGQSIVRHGAALVPVFTLKHLSVLSGTPYGVLREIVGRDAISMKAQPYRIFRIRKRLAKTGDPQRFRTICVPSPMLLRVQRYIHEHILVHLPVHPASIAYNPGRMMVVDVAVHCECKWLIKVDIKNYFEAIPEQVVYRVFRAAGYPALISFEMARLCTRVPLPFAKERPFNFQPNRSERYSIASYSKRLQGSLPQGSPSSPLLANLCSRLLDERIEALALRHGLIYTRYADDVALSSMDSNFGRGRAKHVIRKLYAIMRDCGFAPNLAKTVVVPPGGRKVLLGLYVDTDRPRLSREFRYNLEQHLHFCLHPDVGAVAHSKHRGFDAVLGFRNHVRGLVAYAVQVDPCYGARQLSDFNKVKWPF